MRGPGDSRAIAALILLKGELDPIIDGLNEGSLNYDDRRNYAEVFATIAGELDPVRLLSNRMIEK